MLGLCDQFKADAVGLDRLLLRGREAEGDEDQFPYLGSQAVCLSVRPREYSPASEKPSHGEVLPSVEPSVLAEGAQDPVPIPRGNGRCCQVQPTPLYSP